MLQIIIIIIFTKELIMIQPGHVLPLRHLRHVCQQVVEDDGQACELEQVSEHRNWREVLEVPDTDEE